MRVECMGGTLRSFAALRMTAVRVCVSKRRKAKERLRGFAKHHEASRLLLAARRGWLARGAGRASRTRLKRAY